LLNTQPLLPLSNHDLINHLLVHRMGIRFTNVFIGILLVFFSINSFSSEKSALLTVGLSVWSGYPESVKGFKHAMQEGGFIEGDNVNYILKASNTDKNKQREIASQFKDLKVDLVYSLTTPGTIIIKEILPADTPIVFSIVTYPADSGLIESFEYSGNNLVGTSNYVPLNHHVDLLTNMLPEAKKVAIFHRKGEPNSKIQTASLTRAFKRQGIKVINQAPVSIEEVKTMALSLIGKVDAFVTTTDTLMQGGGEKALIDISLKNKLPILSSNKSGIENGSTFGPAADFYTLGFMSGTKAVQILLRNKTPAQLESEFQNPPLIMLNKQSIDKLGLTVPSRLHSSAKWVDTTK